MKKILIWMSALIIGTLAGLLQVPAVDAVADFVAAVYTRLFQLLAVPTIVLAVILTLASLGSQGGAGRLFGRTLTYTLLTTFSAAAVSLLLYVLIAPSDLTSVADGAAEQLQSVAPAASQTGAPLTYADHLLSVVPNNVVRPFLDGNVLSLLLLSFAVGIALSRLPESEPRTAVLHLLQGLQDVLFLLIRWLVWTLPLGIVAYAAQLAAQLSAGVIVDSLGRYVAVILGGNVIQFFVVLPLFLLFRGLRPLHTLSRMMPAILTALFTKSSAATLPVTMQTAEQRLGVSQRVSRFVLPICTTININGCAAFILVNSLYVMQNCGVVLTLPLMLSWLFIAVIAAVGNAGVPMGCFFLTLSLMSGVGVPIALMGIILPIYTIIDMVETAENVWSDSCVCAMTDHDISDAKSDE